MRLYSLFAAGVVCIAATACATAGAPAPDLSSAISQPYVADRAFLVRKTPTISAPTVASFRNGDKFYAKTGRYEAPWSYLVLDDGAEGYVFGQPYILDR